MRQAIEEGFIHDVLINYTTYQSFYQLNKKIEDDPELNKKKAASAIARFATLHPYVLAQKTEVIIEHFRQVTMKKIGGKAKAMVVTASREHVVRYKHEFDRYLNEKGYSDIKALVAFSGTVLLDGIPPEYTETGMNGFGEKELPERFAGSEYQILLVAEKYQTGYDEPLLHSMYVDKRLDGVKAVQTLSRLNRTCPGKEDTFILDFVNKREDILAAFQPYYEQTQLTDVTDPNKLYDLKTKIDSFKIIVPADVEAFCEVFFKNKDLHNKREHGQLNALIDVAVVRFDTIEKDDQKDDFVNTLGVFVRLYAFLAQIMPFQDVGLEKFYAYSRFLLKKLPGPNRGPRYDLGDDVALEYYRLQKISEGQIALQKESGAAIKPISEAGTKKDKDEYARLSEIINLLNDRFGTDFTEADKLFFDQIEEEMVLDEKLGLQAVATSFREQTKPKIKGWKPMNGRKVSKDMFIAQVVGKSMEPTIAEGSWCLFRFERGGSRHGIFLIESRQVKDPETGLAFTIKRYHSEKEDLGNDQWRHKRIILSPDNKDFKDIVLENVSGDDFRVVAEFVQIVAS